MKGWRSSVPEDLKAGSLFVGRFRVEREIGRGGMGVVYAARDEHTEREVALKLIARKLAADPTFVERFKRECKAIAGLEHENIVRVYDVNRTDGGQWYLVMQRLEGMSLRTLLQTVDTHRLGVVHAALIAIQLADAVRVAHAKGIWHRDIKPENVFVGKKSHVWLLDFGLAKRAGTAPDTDEQRPLGTFRYMPPETIHGKARPDGRADLYQIGCVFFEMLTGASPYDAADDPTATVTDVLAAHVFTEPARLRDRVPSAPPAAERIVQRLLAKDPAQRHASAEELGNDLHGLLLSLVPANHPAALKGSRHRSNLSGEWPVADAETPLGDPVAVKQELAAGRLEPAAPHVEGARPRPFETAPIETLSVEPDRAPSWLPRGPRRAPVHVGPTVGSDDARKAQRTARGTVRMLPRVAEPGNAALATTDPAPVSGAPSSPPWSGTQPMTLRSAPPASGGTAPPASGGTAPPASGGTAPLTPRSGERVAGSPSPSVRAPQEIAGPASAAPNTASPPGGGTAPLPSRASSPSLPPANEQPALRASLPPLLRASSTEPARESRAPSIPPAPVEHETPRNVSGELPPFSTSVAGRAVATVRRSSTRLAAAMLLLLIVATTATGVGLYLLGRRSAMQTATAPTAVSATTPEPSVSATVTALEPSVTATSSAPEPSVTVTSSAPALEPSVTSSAPALEPSVTSSATEPSVSAPKPAPPRSPAGAPKPAPKPTTSARKPVLPIYGDDDFNVPAPPAATSNHSKLPRNAAPLPIPPRQK